MARVALDRIANPSLEVQCAIIPTELVKRDSCRRINSFNDLPGKFCTSGNETNEYEVS
jgi:hypothetical protein